MDSSVRPVGETIGSLLSCATQTVLIVAPFIRSEALARLLERVPNEVEAKVVTRWLASDLLSGASDLGVYDLTRERSIPLLLHQELHAKLFAADDKVLVGSANVTLAALGWRSPANLELLASVPRTTPTVKAFEADLWAGSKPATEEKKRRLQSFLEHFGEQATLSGHPNLPVLASNWLPQTNNPHELYYVYNEQTEKVAQTMLPDMRQELAQLKVPPSLPEVEFRVWVGATIAEAPLVDRVLRHIDEIGSLDESKFAELLQEAGIAHVRPDDGLHVLQRWLGYFLGNFSTTRDLEYRKNRDSTKLSKASAR